MNALVTIGPTQEPIDSMRILSNRSSGSLGTLLAVTLAMKGHSVVALRGVGATADTTELQELGITIIPFATTEDLRSLFEQTSKKEHVDVIFHAAAVSDFYLPGAGQGKIPTSNGSLTLTLQPTPKILPMLRGWFPEAIIVGWKFEAANDREKAIAVARKQIEENQTNACVLNGPSYGEGFGFVEKGTELHHLPDNKNLCNFLSDWDKSF